MKIYRKNKFNLRLVQIVFLLLLPVTSFAIDGDVTDDNSVDVNDLRIFMDYWLSEPNADPNCDFNEDGNVNFLDYVILAGNWQSKLIFNESGNIAPVAQNINTSAYTAEIQRINLIGSDYDNGPYTKLYYKIVSVPAHGKLTDISVGAGIVQSAPYTLLSPINIIGYQSDTDYIGMDSFTYQAYDGNSVSNIATVDVNVAINTLDNITFDGQGFVTVPDSDKLEFDDNFSFALWLKTEWPYSGIIRKRGSSGAGFELKITDMRPAVYFYDANNNEKVVIGAPEWRIDKGVWSHLVVSRNSTSVTIYLDSIEIASSSNIFATSFVNDANLIIGSSGDKHFKGEIDRISWYATAKGVFEVSLMYYVEGRNDEDGGVLVPDYYTRFNFNEGSGTDVNDMTWDITGVFNDPNHVQWVPGNALSQRLTPKLRGRERFRPDTFHFRNYRE